MNTKYLAALKIPIVVLCLLGTGLAAYLFVYVTHQTDYLVGRDFRLLATIGNQIEESIANDRRILSNLFLVQSKSLVDPTLRDERIRQADFVPILSSAKIVAWPGQGPKTRPTPRQSDQGVDVLLLQFLERDSLATWIRREESPAVKRSQAIVQLGLDDLLAPLMKREVERGIFDVLLVAANDGRVIFETEDQKARITRLDSLTSQNDPKNPSPTKFEDLARAPAMVDVTVSGARYKLFTWPCCGSMMAGSGEANRNNDGWVIGGLVADRALAAESHAASFSIMACVLAVLLLAGFSWPFLKLSLVGETQRVKAHDVVLVGLGALLGMALLTVSGLDLFAYHRLEAVLDGQLQGFAEEISQRAHGEIVSAYDELTRLEEVAGSSTQLSRTGIGNLATNALFKERDFDAYPFFDSFSILDERGFQSGKLTFSSFVPPLIDVNDREYFTYWRSAHTAQAFLQPVQSATTGAREAVLSKVVSKPVLGKRLEVAIAPTATIRKSGRPARRWKSWSWDRLLRKAWSIPRRRGPFAC